MTMARWSLIVGGVLTPGIQAKVLGSSDQAWVQSIPSLPELRITSRDSVAFAGSLQKQMSLCVRRFSDTVSANTRASSPYSVSTPATSFMSNRLTTSRGTPEAASWSLTSVPKREEAPTRAKCQFSNCHDFVGTVTRGVQEVLSLESILALLKSSWTSILPAPLRRW